VDDPGDPRLDDFRHLTDPVARRGIEQDRSMFIVEGKLAVARLFESEYRARSLLVDDRRAESSADLVEAARARGVPVYVGSSEVVAGTVGFALHRGVVAAAHRPQSPDAEAVIAAASRVAGAGGGRPVVAVLEGLNDHENIGALFRNAAAFGVAAVLLDPTCADPLYRRSVRVSIGHVLHVPFARLAPWPDGLELLRASGYVVAALDPGSPWEAGVPPSVTLSGLRDLVSVTADTTGTERSRPAGVALLFGAEGPGLSDAARSAADCTVSIPMADGVDSLNVATAAAVVFHALTGR
jgi:tRNA G18 (ribose-2'-O)-methylase SpoU